MEKEGYEGKEEDGMEDGAPPPFPTAAMAADDGEEPRTRAIMRALYARYRKQARRWHNYRVLFGFLAFMLLFFIVLFLQRTAAISYAVHSTVADVVTPQADIFNSKEDIYDWLEGLVGTIWSDPVCGDGACELPFEYPSYGGFGCKSDCGRMPQKFAVTPIQIDLYFDFSHPLGSLPASDLMLQASWNLCPLDTDFSPNCYYESDQAFGRLTGEKHVLLDDIPDGEYSLKIKSDLFNKVYGAVRNLTAVAEAAVLYKTFIAYAAAKVERDFENTVLTDAISTTNYTTANLIGIRLGDAGKTKGKLYQRLQSIKNIKAALTKQFPELLDYIFTLTN